MLYFFSLHILENTTQKYTLRPPLILFSRFVSLLNSAASASSKLFLDLEIFSYLIQLWSKHWSFLGISSLFSFGRILHPWSEFSSRFNMPLRIAFKVAFVCVLPLFRYLCFYFLSGGLGNLVLHHHSRNIQGRDKWQWLLWYMIRNLVYFLAGVHLVSKVHMLNVSIHYLRVCLTYSGSYPSMFLFPKAMSYPRILTIHCLFIYLSLGITWIDCCISQIGKILLCPQENLIFSRLFLGLLFNYSSCRIQNMFLQM